ncbi:TIGR00341 family protein [Candidatus Kaiserbacteria bacterium CG10_big_fil_rev_8_21_14_0_10_49_17]|uniref:TIGR00341 family protein n=1 Tax=Candidatus Kaiserbacteria bacterium CG10_big_fil_rev_8_21_14_0_10_49_17 TaxID=1974609 RepID=A0A2M6WEN9_9BACT|nr:MAG: TIGR00341 family protein [Candidatus Kaiserbacteria bacterium CG10_big_fil_rev_8_21_14_0_10_49_17]
MSFISRIRSIDESDKSIAVEKLIAASTPDFDFFLLTTLSVLMATFGLLLDSATVIIGSMLIAPLLYPILSLSVSVSMADYRLLRRSLSTLGKATVLTVGASAIITLFFSYDYSIGSEILSRAEPSLVYFLVAVISGIAVSYTMVRPDLSETLPGIAVAVALLPPLATVGVGIAELQWTVVSGAIVLFLLNVVGIVGASIVMFSLMNLYSKRSVAERTVVREEVRVVKEKEKAKEIDEWDKAVDGAIKADAVREEENGK